MLKSWILNMQRGLPQELALGDRRQTFYIEKWYKLKSGNLHLVIILPTCHCAKSQSISQVCRIILLWPSKAHRALWYISPSAIAFAVQRNMSGIVTATSTVKHVVSSDPSRLRTRIFFSIPSCHFTLNLFGIFLSRHLIHSLF